MGLPPFFTTTTLRTMSATTGQDSDHVREVAQSVHYTLRVGAEERSARAGTMFVELAARTIGSLQIEGSDEQRARLESLALRINPNIRLDEDRGRTRRLSV